MVSMDGQQLRIDKIEAGHRATVIEGIFAPWVQQRISTEVMLMVAEYRGKEMTHDMMVGRIAGIAMLMTAVSELESTQRQAAVAADKEFNANAT